MTSATVVRERHAVGAVEVDTRRRVGAAAMAAAVTATAVVLALLRQQGKRSWQSFYIEDGSLLPQGLMDGTTANDLFQNYAGYLMLTPRLLSLPGSLVPVGDGPAYFAVAGAVVAGLLAAGVYRWSDGWGTSIPVRIALAALTRSPPALSDSWIHGC